MNKPLRILQVVGIMNRGGIETALMNYYRQLDKSKIQFDFAVHGNGIYDDEIRALGGQIFLLPRLTSPLSLIHWKTAFNNIFKDHHYSIIHAQCGSKNRFILHCAKESKIPVRIAHSHGMPPWWYWIKNFKVGILRLFFALFWNWNATHFFAIGQEAGNSEFGTKISKSDRFHIVRLAIDCEKFRFNSDEREKIRKTFCFSDRTIILGHVGRFDQQKNHAFLIRLFTAFHTEFPDSKLLLTGNGPLEENIKNQVKNVGLTDHVLFLGSRSDIPQLMNAMDIFIFPSYSETFGIVAIEAQSSGLPCLISDTLPHELKITDLVSFIALSEPVQKWIETLKNIIKTPRTNLHFKEIEAAGFDIVNNTLRLEKFYLEHEEK